MTIHSQFIEFKTIYNRETGEFVKGIIDDGEMTHMTGEYTAHLARAEEVAKRVRLWQGEFKRGNRLGKI